MINKLLGLSYFAFTIIILSAWLMPKLVIKEVSAFLLLKGLIWLIVYKKNEIADILNVIFGVYLMMMSFGYFQPFLTGLTVIFLLVEAVYYMK